jgi:hypothetical protein
MSRPNNKHADDIGLTQDDLTSIDLAYAEFNSRRTFTDPRPASFTVRRIGPLVVTLDVNRPDQSYYQRVLGLNAGTFEHLVDAISVHEAHGVGTRVDLDRERRLDGVADALAQRGMVQSGVLRWLAARPVRASAPQANAWPVERWDSDQADAFLDVLEAQGASMTGELREARRMHYCTDRFRSYVIRTATGEPIAAATMFIHDVDDGERTKRAGLLGNAWTAPAARRHGCQQSLLAARCADACRSNVQAVITDVEPGTTSDRNAQRLGLAVWTDHELWERRRDDQATA